MDNQLKPGVVVGERYAIESVIGRGGMGTVYGATHLLTRRRVALKLVEWGAGGDRSERQERFMSEARNAVAVRHRHVVDVLDMGMHTGEPYLVMERLEGESLEDLLLRVGRLSPELTLALLLPIMGALAALHDRAIVHRDVKPSNIFLAGAAGEVTVPKLLDFGLSRAHSDVRLTRAGVVLGTPLYMAPEHAAGSPTSGQADVWSLGVVFFECLTGALPYASTEPHVVATQVLAGHVRSVRALVPDIDAGLALAIDRALTANLKQRHADMRDFASAVVEAAMRGGIPLPENPEPVGLPDYRTWLVGEGRASGQRLAEQPTQPVAAEPHATGSAPSQAPVVQQAARITRGPGILMLAVLLSLLAWIVYRASNTLNGPQETELAPPLPVQQPVVRSTLPPTAPVPSVRSLDVDSSAGAVMPPPAQVAPAEPQGNNESPRRRRRSGERERSAEPTPAPAPTDTRTPLPPLPAPPGEIETEWK